MPARFVMQRHDARHLHYDVRLEMAGVFKSWALPKGPPLIVGERRLAIMTTDHELSFGDFAGMIPDREYGAGIITIWDQGWYTPEGDPVDALARGELRFMLHGIHLTGRFRLIQPQHRKWQERAESKKWLLINDGPG